VTKEGRAPEVRHKPLFHKDLNRARWPLVC
jgi:hypothetical protein